MSKESINTVKAEFNYLIQQKNGHRKITEIDYSQLIMQNYIKNNNILTDKDRCILFQFAIIMLR